MLEFLSKHHNPSIGYDNFTLMRKTFGFDEMKAMCATLSVSVCDATPVMDGDDTERRNLVADGNNSIQVVADFDVMI